MGNYKNPWKLGTNPKTEIFKPRSAQTSSQVISTALVKHPVILFKSKTPEGSKQTSLPQNLILITKRKIQLNLHNHRTALPAPHKANFTRLKSCKDCDLEGDLNKMKEKSQNHTSPKLSHLFTVTKSQLMPRIKLFPFFPLLVFGPKINSKDIVQFRLTKAYSLPYHKKIV